MDISLYGIVILDEGSFFPIVFDVVLLCFYIRTSQYIVSLNKYLESIKNKFSIGMRFRMRFEGEDSPARRYLDIIIGQWSLTMIFILIVSFCITLLSVSQAQ